MSLSVQKTPPAIALVENGLIFELLSSQPWTAAAKAVLNITINETQADYDDQVSFVLEFADSYQLTFKFMDSPNDSGLQLRNWDAGDSLAVFKGKLIEDLEKCYFIRSRYSVGFNSGTGKLVFTALQSGPDYNITLKSSTAGWTLASETAGTNSTMPADYRAWMALQRIAEDAPNEYQTYAEELVPVDGQLVARTNFGPYMRNQVEYGFVFPQSETPEFFKAYEGLVVDINYAEYYSGNVRQISKAATIMLLPGGISLTDYENLEAISEDYFDDETRITRFLNWCPAAKITSLGTPERLYFLTTPSEHDVVIKLKAYRELISQTTDVDTFAADGKVYELLCGLHELLPEAVEGEIIKYEIWLQDVNEKILSETRTFWLDTAVHGNTRVFLWRNSFGAYETLRCTGEQSISDNIGRTEFELLINDNYRNRVHESESLPDIQIHTGWLNGLAHRQWLTDFLLSREVYLIEGNGLNRVSLTTGKVLRETDNEFTYALAFAYRPDAATKHHSAVEI